MTPESVIRRIHLITHTAALCLAASFAIVAVPNAVAESGITNIINGTSVNSGGYTVGTDGTFNALIVTNAGVLTVTGHGIIGNSAVSTNNIGIVTGPGSLWTNSGTIYVGVTGSFNQLTIANGGTVMTTNIIIGNDASCGNSVTIDGGNLYAFNSIQTREWPFVPIASYGTNGGLYVGMGGSLNSLTLSNSGHAVNYQSYLGYNSGANSNSVLVTGAGTTWATSNLYVGYQGSFNQMTITNGGNVFVDWPSVGIFLVGGTTAINIGYGSGANSNSLLVSGVGSVCSNQDNLVIGSGGNGNSMTIANGGQVFDDNGTIGSGMSNRVLVTGSGAVWNNSVDLSIGDHGIGNNLTIANGGVVINSSAFIGGPIPGYFESPDRGFASNNSVLVTGAGSVWSNNGTLYVGYASSGGGNGLMITSNATVEATSVLVGYGTGAFDYVTVSGGNLTATNASDGTLRVRHGMLTLNSGTVVVNLLHLIDHTNSVMTFNAGLLASGGSAVTNGSTFQVGDGTDAATFQLLGGTHSFASGLFINTNATLTGTGSITGSITNAGLIVPGGSNAIGIITDTGNLTMLNIGAVTMDLAGTNAWLYDQLNLTGALTFNGTLTLSLLDGYTPQLGDLFDLFDFSSSGGSFSLINLPALSAGVYWNTSLLYSRGQIFAGSDIIYSLTNVVLVNGFASNHPGACMIGSNSEFNGLIVTNAGVLTSSNGIIGNSAAANNNYALVTGAGSLWSNSAAVYVGATGSFNQLIATNGGRVMNTTGYVGYDVSAGNNKMLVAGAGSVWSNSDALYVGYSGSSNALTIANGGTVIATDVTIGWATSKSNIIAISGGSLYATNTAGSGALNVNYGTLNINSGTVTANQLLVTNGASSVVNFNGGTLNSSDSVVSNGSVFVVGNTGTGAIFNLVGGTHSFNNGLMIGDSGFGNSLLITNGAQVFVSGNGYVGNAASASSNFAMVTDMGSQWNNSADLYVGNTGSFNQLTIASSGMAINSNGYIGNASGASNNAVLVSSAGSVWSSSADLAVGNGGSLNRLMVTNGGTVFSVNGYVGCSSAATNNFVLVTGGGSVWSNSSALFVGNSGAGNMLMVSDGGQVFNTNGYVGYSSGASNNAVLVGGAGSVWSSSADLAVGNDGSLNWLMVTNGGTVFSVNGYVGCSSAATNNFVLVTGEGSVWSNSSALFVGNSGAGNMLMVSNGGQVFNVNGYVGNTSAASNNMVNVTGTGSLWSSSGNLIIGTTGAFNNLTITNGGTVADANAYIGYNVSANNNSVWVSGTGSTWSNSGSLYVGYSGSTNTLMIADGGLATATNVVVGSAPSTGSFITVSGGWLYATNTTGNGSLNVGYGTLNLNGGTVTVNQLIVTNGANSMVSFNGGTLNSGGSMVANEALFQVGNGISSATLILQGDNQVFANGLFINTNATLISTGAITGSITDAGVIVPGNSNSIGVITDSGSLTMLAGGAVTMELAGTNNGLYDQFNLTGALSFGGTLTLSLLDGFTVSAGDRFDLFDFSSSSGAFGLVYLPVLDGSLFWNTSLLYTSGEIFADTNSGSSLTVIDGFTSNYPGIYTVGANNDSNRLIVTNAGVLASGGGILGNSANANNNNALVTGAGSVWSNSGGLYVGYFGSSNNLTIASGGTVTAPDVVIGHATSKNNVITVSGGSLYVTNSAGSGTLNVNYGTLNINSGTLTANQLLVTNKASSAVNLNGGTFNIGGSVISNGSVLVVGNVATGATLNLLGGNHLWANGLTVGNLGSASSLSVASGATVQSSGTIILGNFSPNNRLIISNGNFVAYDTTVFRPTSIGNGSGASNNSVLVTGTNALWYLNGQLVVGATGNGNSVKVSSGACMRSEPWFSVSYIGNSSYNNSVLVTDSGSVWTNLGNLIIGNAGSSNALVISNGGKVALNGSWTAIGAQLNANSNTVVVTGPGSVWTNTGNLEVGYGANFNNSMTISNGGSVFSLAGWIGDGGSFSGNPNATDNFVVVTGTGSLWSLSRSLTIGNDVGFNRLSILNGGQVSSAGGTIGSAAAANNDSVLIAGVGSLWSNSGTLYVGSSGSGNSLIITNGGQAVTKFSDAYIGYNAGANSNSVLVSGNDSTWNNVRTIFVGNAGGFNQLTITNGGCVQSVHGWVGYAAGASNNGVLVSGTNSVWANSGILSISGGSGNQVTLSDGGRIEANGLNNYNGGVFSMSGGNAHFVNVANAGVINQSSGELNMNSVNNSGAWTISGGVINAYDFTEEGHGTLTVSGGMLNGSLTIGNTSSFNQLIITNGGVMTGGGRLGNTATSSNNSVLVTGAGSVWSNGPSYVGVSGSGNNLIITNGGAVVGGGSTTIGEGSPFYDGGNNNTVVVSGFGSVWQTGGLEVGDYGSGNTLAITDGGMVLNAGNGWIGSNKQGSNNTVLVTGPGSLWSNSVDLMLGLPGSSLLIADGGRVVNNNGRLNANYCSVQVTGAGSVWSNSSSLQLGFFNSSDSLIVSNGGQVFSSQGIIGEWGGMSSVLVDGAGSLWSNATNLYVGRSGSSNQLSIVDGGTVSSANGCIGGSYSLVLVTGAGSLWTNSGDLYVGLRGFRCGLVITNGGVVVNSNGYIGLTQNQDWTWVAGNGSIWTNSGTLSIGNESELNTLTICNSGQVFDTDGVIGNGIGANGNSVLVTGTESLWHNSGQLLIGKDRGSGNSLTIENGGTVVASNISVGIGYSGPNVVNLNGGTLTVGGSSFASGQPFIVGNSAYSATLNLLGGTHTFADGLTVGGGSSTTTNNVIVSGANVAITNQSANGTLFVQSGNLAIDSSTVVVDRLIATNGISSAMTFSTSLLRSGGTMVSNGTAFAVGNGVLWVTFDMLGGSHSFADGLFINTNGWLTGTGAITGVITNAGTIAPGNSPGIITGSNDLTLLSTSLLQMQLAGTNAWLYDQINLSGVFNFGGALTLSLLDGFNPVVGDRFDLFDFGAASGAFGQTNLPALSPWLYWNTESLYTSGEIFAGLLGDSLAVTNVTDGVTVNCPGIYMVGTNGPANGLIVTNAGVLISDSGVVGNSGVSAYNNAWVTGAGSLWSNGSDLIVGATGGFNRLSVANGGTALATNVVIGYGQDSINNLLVVSGGQLFVTNALAGGALDIRRGAFTFDSGIVAVDRLLATNFASSVVNFNGGTLHSGGSTISNGSVLQAGNGASTATLHLVGGNHSFANGLFINTNTWLTGTGAITGVITNAGSIAPGDSAGILTGSGDLTLLSTSLLQMQLAGTNDWLYDQINLAGMFNFGGALTLSLLDGFNPHAGDRFDLFDFSSSSGVFSTTNLPTLDPLLYWNLSALYTTGEIEADRVVPGVIVWGDNSTGQTNVPVGLTAVAAIGAGEGHNMALRSDGTIVAWGVNESGQTNVPEGLTDVVAVGAANHSMALKADGTVIAWGRNLNGETNVPEGLTGVVAIAAGTHHSMALKNDGTIVAWGANDSGQTNVPVDLSGVVAIAGSQWHSMALKSNGTVVAWGNYGGGPAAVPAGLSNVVAIAAGPYHSMALKSDGTVTAWGDDFWGWGLLNVPAGLSNVVAIAAASHHSAALKSDGTVVAWGENAYGQIDVPAGLSGVVAVGARALNTVVLKPCGPSITTSGPVLSVGAVGLSYDQALQASGGNVPYSWGIVSGRLPTGLVLGSSGNISGTPTASGLSCFRVRVTDADGMATEKDFALNVFEPTPVLLAAASRKTHGAAGALDHTLNLNPAVNPTVEPRKSGPTQLLFTFNKAMTAADGTLDASEFTLTNATYVSASILSSNLTLNLTNAVDQSKVTVVLNGFSDLTGNPLVGTNAVKIRSLYGDVNQSGTVSITDMQVIKFKLGSALSATNFLSDINLSGAINITDMQVAKMKLSHTVPLNSVDTGANSLETLLNTTLVATADTSVSAVTLGEALGAPELSWSTDGDALWTTTMALDGSLIAWSGGIGHLNVSWVETTVTGPGTLSFQWKVSSEEDADYLTFSMDGVDQPGCISGEVDWQTLTFNIPSGTHRLTWTYAKNRSNAAGLDAGWLRKIVYQRNP